MKKTLIGLLMVLALFVSAVPATAFEPKEQDIAPDVLLVRPIGMAAVAVGSAIFVVSLPFSLPTGTAHKVAQRLILDPVEFTFVRPVGDFDYKLGTWKTAWSDTE